VPGRSLRILLAEDNKINQTFALALLHKAGHTVDIAENGNQAVEAVRNGNYDVVLMDVQMPDLDGIGATLEIRTLAPPKRDIPIIALTANVMQGVEEEYRRAGMNDFVPKPIETHVLFAKLATVQRLSGDPDCRVETVAQQDEVMKLDEKAQSLDLEKIESIAAVLSREAVRDYLTLYLVDTRNRVAKIEMLVQQQDFEGIQREAHDLISTAGNVGAQQVCELAKALGAAATSDHMLVATIAEDLAAATVVAARRVQTWLDEHPADRALSKAIA